ncbi:D-2-hydroxyglutarate dehydrogenase, mitochondrial [Lathyrus oleraceus]|uniref:D-2-hydroxyglutarate dehydrogenase, mitochondrial n=1 Tax=Pisum sativum TaxID=3888 RepID=UPI0021CF7AA4|nr:D-2-hydroxyglutarate dehydrogenase, mitochondrial-like [Pisum sativum]
MMNRNSRDTLRFLSRFHHHQQQNPSLLPSASPSSQFTSVTGFHENSPQLQRNVVSGEHKALSFFNPLRNSLKNEQLGGGNPFEIHQKCYYGSMGGVVQRSSRFSELNDDDVKYFQEILGKKNVVQDEDKLSAANIDRMHKYKGSSKILLQPCNTDQVSEILKYCNSRNLVVVPQGGNTGLVGGSVPVFDEVIVSLSSMNKIVSFDKVSGILVCEAGCILENLMSFMDNEG